MQKNLDSITDFPESKIKKNQSYDDCSINEVQELKLSKNITAKPTSLTKAARNGRLLLVKQLVAEGANLESRNVWGGTPLYLAVLKKHYEIAQFLLQSGANPNAMTMLHDSPLNLAIGFINVRFAILLIENGANVNQTVINGDKPLHTATRYCNLQMIETLLRYGADIEAKSEDDQTPVEIAINHMDLSAVRILVWYGANVLQEYMDNAIYFQTTYDEHDQLVIDTCNLTKLIDSLLFSEEVTAAKLNAEMLNKFHELTVHGRDLIFSRILFKSFRNKTHYFEENNEVISNLIAKIDFVINELNLDIFDELKALLHNLSSCIIISSYQNEVGRIPSLFTLSINALKKFGISFEETEKVPFSDIIDKVKALERVKDFCYKTHLVLKVHDPSNSHSQDISQIDLGSPQCTCSSSEESDVGILLGQTS